MSRTRRTSPAGDDAPPSRVARLVELLRVLGERLVLGAVAGGTTSLVLAWAGMSWRTALLAGAVGAIAVAVAAWVAATVPPVPGPDGSTTAAPRRAAPDEPGTSGHRRPAP